jgi:hypothetical protein
LDIKLPVIVRPVGALVAVEPVVVLGVAHNKVVVRVAAAQFADQKLGKLGSFLNTPISINLGQEKMRTNILVVTNGCDYGVDTCRDTFAKGCTQFAVTRLAALDVNGWCARGKCGEAGEDGGGSGKREEFHCECLWGG